MCPGQRGAFNWGGSIYVPYAYIQPLGLGLRSSSGGTVETSGMAEHF